MDESGDHPRNDLIAIQGLAAGCIVGIFDWERAVSQKVVIDLELPCDARRASQNDRIEDTLDYKRISKSVISFVEQSRFYLVETLAENIASFCINKFRVKHIKVRVSKPGALRGAENVSVTVFREISDYLPDAATTVYLSIGSNIDPERNIGEAIRLLQESFFVNEVSQIYETLPYGAANQPKYWNLIMELRTELSETELKDQLLHLENHLGRIRSEDKFASRNIDIDILIFGKHWHTGSASEESSLVDRAFILVPLAEIRPDLIEPGTGSTIQEHLASKAFAEEPVRRLGDWAEVCSGAVQKVSRS
ncbi:MAG: dihydroneopterin aldolase [Candidatus Omnitrophica bacterium]|nr:dihydroneopterin aldolase [Candidatus Omnitrophota bacterium]